MSDEIHFMDVNMGKRPIYKKRKKVRTAPKIPRPPVHELRCRVLPLRVALLGAANMLKLPRVVKLPDLPLTELLRARIALITGIREENHE